MTGGLDVEKFLKVECEGYVCMFKCGAQDRDIDERNVTEHSEVAGLPLERPGCSNQWH